jgi:AraC family transcriptional regulator, regulatory protein of adaptative response / methylated-DNA-[protein]-cysteine methyltransferase
LTWSIGMATLNSANLRRENWNPDNWHSRMMRISPVQSKLLGGRVEYPKDNGGAGELSINGASYGVNGTGARIAFTIVDSSFGRLLIATTRVGICWIGISDSDAHLEAELRSDLSAAEIARDDDGLGTLAGLVVDFIEGHTQEIAIPVDIRATPFQLAVWKELCAIPWGATRSYGEIAKRLGRPDASRAVGAANGSNPLAIIIPCHRAIGADCSLTGYRWGLDYKRRLLDHECALAQTSLSFG